MAAYTPGGFPSTPAADARARRAERQRMNRQLATERRASRAVYRAQRAQVRQLNRVPRRRSFVGPLLVIAGGCVAASISSGYVSAATFFAWYARWWPTLLIFAGLALAAEWTFDRVRDGAVGDPARPLTPRRSLSPGLFLLLLALAATGLTAGSVQSAHAFSIGDLHFSPVEAAAFFGARHERDQEIVQPFPAGTSLFIANPRGDVTVTGKSDDNKIHITVNKTVYSFSDEDADRKADALSPEVKLSEGTLRITPQSSEGGSSDLEITVPDFARVTVEADRGDVRVVDTRAPVNATVLRGELNVSSITGDVTAHLSRSDSSFVAHNVTGAVHLRGRADDLTVTDVSGEVSLEGEFFGETHLEHLGSGFNFETSRTHLTVAKLDGEVDISSDEDLTGDHLSGPTTLRTRSRNISFEHLGGAVNVTNSNGSVDLKGLSPLGEVTVANQNGEVNVEVAPGEGFALTAQADGGTVNNDFSAASEHDGKGFGALNVNGGTTPMSLHTTHADINLRKYEP